MGKWLVLRVPDAPVQSHPQPAGALPHEPQLRPHRQVVCQAIPKRGKDHQQKVRPAFQHRIFCRSLFETRYFPVCWQYSCD